MLIQEMSHLLDIMISKLFLVVYFESLKKSLFNKINIKLSLECMRRQDFVRCVHLLLWRMCHFTEVSF